MPGRGRLPASLRFKCELVVPLASSSHAAQCLISPTPPLAHADYCLKPVKVAKKHATTALVAMKPRSPRPMHHPRVCELKRCNIGVDGVCTHKQLRTRTWSAVLFVQDWSAG